MVFVSFGMGENMNDGKRARDNVFELKTDFELLSFWVLVP